MTVTGRRIMSQYSEEFLALARAYASTGIEHPHLRPVTLAQWILESGYGQSSLAREHMNFGGLKWRPEMEGFAEPVVYQAHDGEEEYCKFESPEAFIRGYWHFLERSPYEGWHEHAGSAERFIRFVGPIYTPTALYADSVLSLVGKATALLVENDAADLPKLPGTSEPPKPPVEFDRSPNCSSRNGSEIRRIVMHYTTGRNVDGTIEWFKNPESQRSAHYVIARDGKIYQMVADHDKAWHARTANRDSIGIEHSAAPGDRMTPEQERASIALVKWLLAEYKIPRSQVTGHRYTPENLGATDCPHSLFGDRTEGALRAWVNANL
jgi:hypothetical protein